MSDLTRVIHELTLWELNEARNRAQAGIELAIVDFPALGPRLAHRREDGTWLRVTGDFREGLSIH